MTSAQWLGWQAFDAIEPFGDRRADLRNGILAALLANIFRSKDAPIKKPEDFMPFEPKAVPAPVSTKTLSQQIRAVFSGFKRRG